MATWKTALYLLAIPLPWPMRKFVLTRVLHWRIGEGARIGFSFIAAESVFIGAGAKIGHLNVVRNLESLRMGEHSILNNRNWIAGYPRTGNSFLEWQDRVSSLVIGEHAAVTNAHIIDCTDAVTIGAFSTLAGYGSQILTHSINIETSVQECMPVSIGTYCFVGTRTILLAGSEIPDQCVVAAGSVVTEKLPKKSSLYAGVPARPIKAIDSESAYFLRNHGVVA